MHCNDALHNTRNDITSESLDLPEQGFVFRKKTIEHVINGLD